MAYGDNRGNTPGPEGLTDDEQERNKPAEVEVELPLDIPEDAINLVPHLDRTQKGKDFLEELGRECLATVKRDWESSSKYRERRRKQFKLCFGELEPKTWPWEDCANGHLPIMLERMLRMVAVVFGELFKENERVFAVLPSGPDDHAEAEILTLHGNWQLKNEITDFLRQQYRAIFEFFGPGDVYCHSYRDMDKNVNRHDILTCEEIIIPYVWKSVQPDMSDIPHKTRVLRKYEHELKALEKLGVYHGIARILKNKSSFDSGPELVVKPEADKAEGREPAVDDPNAPYVLYEYHCHYKIPGMPEEREYAVKVTIDEGHGKVLAINIREEDDWRDRERFKAQTAEMEMYQQSMQQHQQLQMQEQMLRERMMMPDIMPEDRMIMEQALAQGIPEAPMPPDWMQPGMTGPKPIKKVPIEEFSHGVCIDQVDHSLGVGYWATLQPFQETADTALSQFTDAATLANCPMFVTVDSLEFSGSEPSGELRFSPGKFLKAKNISIEQLNGAFKELRAGQANMQLLDLIRMAEESADGVTSASGVLSGEPGKSNETYRGIATRMEAARSQLTVSALRYQQFLEQILKNNARLNAAFLPDHEILAVVDHLTGTVQEIEIGRELYERNYKVSFTADTRFSSKAERVAEADQLLGMIAQMGQMVPFPPPFIYEAVVKALKARGLYDMVPHLGPRPEAPPPPPPPGMGPPGMPPGPPSGPPGPPQGPPPGQGPIQGPRPETPPS